MDRTQLLEQVKNAVIEVEPQATIFFIWLKVAWRCSSRV